MIRFIACLLVCILGGCIVLAEQDMVMEAFVWNSKGFRVPLYSSADLCSESQFGNPYLLNGCSIRLLDPPSEEQSLHVAFLDDTYWVKAEHIVFLPPTAPLTISRTVIEDTKAIPQAETTISKGTTVEIVGFIGSSVFIYWENEYRAISPTALEWVEIRNDSPDYLVSKANAISTCLQHLKTTHNISDDVAQTMRQEFLHYFTMSSPALYLIHFYSESGEIYSYHFDGEHNIILYSSYAPYGVG